METSSNPVPFVCPCCHKKTTGYTVKSFTFEKDFKFKENESFCFANLRNTAIFYVKGIIFSKG